MPRFTLSCLAKIYSLMIAQSLPLPIPLRDIWNLRLLNLLWPVESLPDWGHIIFRRATRIVTRPLKVVLVFYLYLKARFFRCVDAILKEFTYFLISSGRKTPKFKGKQLSSVSYWLIGSKQSLIHLQHRRVQVNIE